MTPIIRDILLPLLVRFEILLVLLLPPCLSFDLVHRAWTGGSGHNSITATRPQSTTTPTPISRRRPALCVMAMERGTRDSGFSFRTEVEVAPWPSVHYLSYTDSFLLLGSCFSENIGDRLCRSKLNTKVNPSHGLLFSPVSAATALDRMASGVPYGDGDPEVVISEGTGLYCSLDHHSSLSSMSRLVKVMHTSSTE